MTSPFDHVPDLAAWLAASGLDELDLTGPDGHLRLRRGEDARTIPGPACEADDEEEPNDTVPSPGIGRFLAAHPLRAEPLVAPGERVLAGQTLALLRNGTLLLPVTAPRDGTVARVVAAEDGLVGFGDPLLELAPEA